MIDLNAARAARREANKEAPVVVIGEKKFTLPVEMPAEVLEDFAKLADIPATEGVRVYEALKQVMSSLLGKDYKAFMAERPSMEDIRELIAGLTKEYGFETEGESQASE